MTDNTARSIDQDDVEFDEWLKQSNEDLVRSTRQALDVEAMLATVKQQAVVDRYVEEQRQREVASAATRAVNGSLALKFPRMAGSTQAKVIQFPKRPDPPAPPPSPASEDGLYADVQSAADGDPQAVARVLATIRPLVVRYCRARVGRHERSFASADDVAQDVCLAVLTALPAYREQGRPFLAFVYGIAAHKVAQAHRAAARRREQPTADMPDTGPVQSASMQGELTRRMKQLLDTLPNRQREIIVLRVVVGLSAEETAEAVGSTPGAVRVAQHRALARLRRTLSAESLV